MNSINTGTHFDKISDINSTPKRTTLLATKRLKFWIQYSTRTIIGSRTQQWLEKLKELKLMSSGSKVIKGKKYIKKRDE